MALDSATARARIEEIPDLPTLPMVVQQILTMANSANTSATDVGELIERDQVLTSKVLRLVNSAYYGFPQQIKTVHHAIVILGFSKVKNVALTASVFDLTRSWDSASLDIPRYWEHSLGTALAAQAVAHRVAQQVAPDEVYVGALLHDFGKVILNQYFADEYRQVVQAALDNHTLLRSMEKELLGFDHQQVGTWTMERWNLPPALVSGVRYHHNPNLASGSREMAGCVHLGDIFARALGIGNGGDPSIPPINASLVDQYRLGKAFYEELLLIVYDEARRAGDFFNLIRHP